MRERHTDKRMKALRICLILFALLLAGFFGMRLAFPRPYAEVVRDSGLDPALVYAVARAESGFDEKAKSSAGACGLMQLMPATARFICMRAGIAYDGAMLFDGAYNLRLGCLYLAYLMERFPCPETALAAYNAGEGVVLDWLKDPSCSSDGVKLTRIPYPETARYVKKVIKFRKIYEFFY